MKENKTGVYGRLSESYNEWKKRRTVKKFYKNLRKAKRLNLYPAIILREHDIGIELMNPDNAFKYGYAWDKDNYTNANVFREGYANSLKFNFNKLKTDESLYDVDELGEEEIEKKLKKAKEEHPELKDKIDKLLEKEGKGGLKNFLRNTATKYKYKVIPSQKFRIYMENKLIEDIIKEGKDEMDVKKWIMLILGANFFLIILLILATGGI